MFDHHAITVFVDELVQNVSSGFYPIVTTSATALRKESLPQFPNRSVIQNSSVRIRGTCNNKCNVMFLIGSLSAMLP